jgi:hypothetical protein
MLAELNPSNPGRITRSIATSPITTARKWTGGIESFCRSANSTTNISGLERAIADALASGMYLRAMK